MLFVKGQMFYELTDNIYFHDVMKLILQIKHDHVLHISTLKMTWV